MGLSIEDLLFDYFGLDDLKYALDKIGKPVSGTKPELVKRIIDNWESRNRYIYDLLDCMEREWLVTICKDFNIPSNGNKEVLKNRIKKEGLLDTDSKVMDSKQNSVTREESKDIRGIEKSHDKSFFSVRNILIILSIGVAVTTIMYNLTNIVEFFSKH